MGDQQIYDTTPHRETLEQSPHAVLSNRGLKVYAGFDEVVLLTTVHRLRSVNKPVLTEEEKAYNSRAERFLRMLHGLRDLDWSLDDYYWLCER